VKKIVYAISTIGDRINNIDYSRLLLHDDVCYLIIHQSHHSCVIHDSILKLFSSRDDVHYIPCCEIGLSSSRNIALAKGKFLAEYIFILDDDVSFSIANTFKLIQQMILDNVDVGCCYHKYTNGGSTLKNVNKSKVNYVNAAKVSSIDICLKSRVAEDHRVFFDTNFGLGTNLPSGEEMIFLTDCLKFGFLVYRYPIEVCTHPPIASGLDFFSSKLKVKAKKEMFKRIFGPKYFLFFFLFVLKKLPRAIAAGYGIHFIKESIFRG